MAQGRSHFMKKFFVFGYAQYYPQACMQDFLKSFETIKEAYDFVALAEKAPDRCDFYEVVDITEFLL